MLKVGLTGGIASGKSAAATAFVRLGVPVVDADRLSHALTAAGQPGLQALVQALGDGILDTHGQLDRAVLRRRIFADPTLRHRVEAVLHPLILAALDRELAAAQGPYAVAVIPLLAESPASQALVDRILVMDSPEDLQIARLMSRDGETSEQARTILAAQASRDARLAVADDILLNASARAALDAAVERLHGFYRELAARETWEHQVCGCRDLGSPMLNVEQHADEQAAAEWLIYEQPLSERVRTFLRLEFLLEQAGHHSGLSSMWDSRTAISAILELVALLTRGDVRTEVLKELERCGALLQRLKGSPEVDNTRLQTVLADLERLKMEMDGDGRPLGAALRESEFLNPIKNRMAIPGGTCQFDLPSYHAWLTHPYPRRARDLQGWMADLKPLKETIALLMALTRESALPTREIAQQGVYQRNFDTNVLSPMVRVMVPAPAGVFPEISAGKHRMAIRFLERHDANVRPQQTKRDISFKLVCCQL